MGNLVDLFAVYCYFGIFSIGSFWNPALPVWTQSRSARADAHHPFHAPFVSGRSRSRISWTPVTRELAAYLLCLSVLLILIAGWVSRKEVAK